MVSAPAQRVYAAAFIDAIMVTVRDGQVGNRSIYAAIGVESLNARYRRAVKAGGHFTSEQAALKCLYLVTRSLDPKPTVHTRWAVRWKPALNVFAITFADRMPAAENQQEDERHLHRSSDRPVRRAEVAVMRHGPEFKAKALVNLVAGGNLTIPNVATHTHKELSEQEAMQQLCPRSFLTCLLDECEIRTAEGDADNPID